MATLLRNAGIYMLRNRNNGKCYIGKDVNLGERAKLHLSLKAPGCRAVHAAIRKYGADNFDVELTPYPNISHKALCEVEKWKIRQLESHISQGGYNMTWGGEGIDSRMAREIQHKRVQDGTHNWLGGESHRKRVQDGTHNWLGGESQRRNNLRRIEAGTHNFLGGEVGRRNNKKRIEAGTHHFLDGEVARRNSMSRVEAGTHHFLDGKISRRNNKKRIEDGTHNFLDPQFYRKRSYAQKIKRKHQRREFYRWISVVLTAKSVCAERIYRKRSREGFFDKEIPDTSKSEQLALF